MKQPMNATVKGELLFNEILAPHTSWRIGGKADCYFSPYDLQDLQNFLANLEVHKINAEPSTQASLNSLTWIGLGSNVLINDEGIRGTVIHTLGMKSEIEQITDNIIRVEMGTTCAKLAKYCAKNSLKGGAFFAGIPGTIGGALAMNAGAFGGETWSRVVKVEVMSKEGKIYSRPPEDYEISYRSIQLKPEALKEKGENLKERTSQTYKISTGNKDASVSKTSIDNQEWFVSGYFQFENIKEENSSEEIKQLLKKRSDSQPIGVFSCGSVFKNPKGTFAAKLIEASQLKGYQVGGAHISKKHANFIINEGTATAMDVLTLMGHIMETVHKDHHIRLEPEVRIIGYEDPYFWVPTHLKENFSLINN